MQKNFSIKYPVITFLSLCLLFVNSYFFFAVFKYNQNIKSIIEPLNTDIQFFNFLSNFGNSTILYSSLTIYAIIIFISVFSFLVFQEFRNKIALNILMLVLAIPTVFFSYEIYKNKDLPEVSYTILQEALKDKELMNTDPMTKAFLNNTDKYYKEYTEAQTLENRIKYLTSFEVFMYDLKGVKTINKDNAEDFVIVVQNHIKYLLNYEYLNRTFVLSLFFMILFNLFVMYTLRKDLKQ